MNGITNQQYLFDTNIVIDLLSGKLPSIQKEINFAISIITEIELLVYPGLTAEDEVMLKDFLKSVEIININELIKAKTIEVKKRTKCKLPDAPIYE